MNFIEKRAPIKFLKSNSTSRRSIDHLSLKVPDREIEHFTVILLSAIESGFCFKLNFSHKMRANVL